MKKKKIVFCYFAPKEIDYTPTDIGYVIAILNQKFLSGYEFEIVQLSYEITKGEEDGGGKIRKKIIQKDVDLIGHQNPDAVFLFIENVLWSKVFAFGRAKSVMKELRRRHQGLFIGLQSHKIQIDQMRNILDENYADCIINGDPERAFCQLSYILERKRVPGVCYSMKTYQENFREESDRERCSLADNLDDIPSPYLEHVFDAHIQDCQARLGNSFRAFLVSSRGCSFGCFYCSRSVKFEKVRYFSPKRFYDELEYLFDQFGVYRFFVLDDAFLYSKQRLLEFEKEFENRLMVNPSMERICLTIMARPETIDKEVVEILAKLNVKYIQIGLQTINPKLQHYMKRTIDVGYFSQIREWLYKYDIELYLDVIIGLPGDSVEWCKKTVCYALSLDPFFFQVKQLYLNPNTLFQLRRLEYAIEIEQSEMEFDVPCVIRASGVDSKYFDEMNDFIMQKIAANPQVYWRYISKQKLFLSDGLYRDQKNTLV